MYGCAASPTTSAVWLHLGPIPPLEPHPSATPHLQDRHLGLPMTFAQVERMQNGCRRLEASKWPLQGEGIAR